MRKCLKRYIVMLLVCVLAGMGILSGVTVSVAAAVPPVYDEAGLLTDEERMSLTEEVNALREKTGWDIFAVTTANAQGKTSMAYADDFYDAQTAEESNGVLVLIDMDNREIYLSTCGEAIRYLEDARIDAILDDAFPYVAEGDYAGCLSVMLSGVECFYDKGIHEDQYSYDVDTGAVSEYRTLTWMEVVPVALLAAGVGIAIYCIVISRYSLKGSTRNDGYPYTRYGKVDLTGCDDRFVHQTVTHHVIQTNSGSGSSGGGGGHRSSVHRSSSGRSHGGGGRSF